MMIQENRSLLGANTLGLASTARYFADVASEADLLELVDSEVFSRVPHYFLGGGSNVVLQPHIDALLIHVNNKGVRVLSETADAMQVEAAAGEGWHAFVCRCLAMGLSGMENLSLIPGQVGAAPVQNIGAYGVEVKDLIREVRCFDVETRTWRTFSRAECRFHYRDSVFKHQGRGRYVIWSVVFELSKGFEANIGYGDLARVAHELAGAEHLSADIVSRAVCQIRREKLPDPSVTGNVGSFFHNPIVDAATAERLLADYPNLPHYPQADGRVKLAAGWLIDQSGLKGHRIGQAAVHTKQALVLVNLGQARYDEVCALAAYVAKEVTGRFGITLHPEPNFW